MCSHGLRRPALLGAAAATTGTSSGRVCGTLRAWLQRCTGCLTLTATPAATTLPPSSRAARLRSLPLGPIPEYIVKLLIWFCNCRLSCLRIDGPANHSHWPLALPAVAGAKGGPAGYRSPAGPAPALAAPGASGGGDRRRNATPHWKRPAPPSSACGKHVPPAPRAISGPAPWQPHPYQRMASGPSHRHRAVPSPLSGGKGRPAAIGAGHKA